MTEQDAKAVKRQGKACLGGGGVVGGQGAVEGDGFLPGGADKPHHGAPSSCEHHRAGQYDQPDPRLPVSSHSAPKAPTGLAATVGSQEISGESSTLQIPFTIRSASQSGA